MSNTELSEILGVDKGSASRLVSTLARYGYAEKDEVTRRYHLGFRVLGLSRSVLTRLPLREAARPIFASLWNAPVSVRISLSQHREKPSILTRWNHRLPYG